MSDEDKPKLPPHVEADARRILRRELDRLLAEELAQRTDPDLSMLVNEKSGRVSIGRDGERGWTCKSPADPDSAQLLATAGHGRYIC